MTPRFLRPIFAFLIVAAISFGELQAGLILRESSDSGSAAGPISAAALQRLFEAEQTDAKLMMVAGHQDAMTSTHPVPSGPEISVMVWLPREVVEIPESGQRISGFDRLILPEVIPMSLLKVPIVLSC